MLLRLILLSLLLLPTLPMSQADEDDHERSRAALLAGEVMPLRLILEKVEKDYPGQVLEVELERERGKWIYEIKLLQENGRLRKLNVDGKTGEPLNNRIKPPKPPQSEHFSPHHPKPIEHENFDRRR